MILRKIPDYYFSFDYIGAPWNHLPTLAGNGGFSLRRVAAAVRSCEQHRNTPYLDIFLPNHEDVIFCRQSDFRYPDDRELHKSFAVETMFSENPVGVHACYIHLRDATEWGKTIENIKLKLL